ncbi:MAG: acyl-CoA dehydratase activase-related protein [Clostridiales bacterium]|nr:acyl-CoA dehydratase activase-related protein [Clostridiales bacterium]
MKIGIPRPLLYYRYGSLWGNFFKELGHEIVLSPKTNKAIQDTGGKYAIDENCLSSKLFLGHIASLEGKCDAVFIPRIADFGKDGIMCTRFEALYDLCVNSFRDRELKFITCNVDLHEKKSEEAAYVGLGVELGSSRGAAQLAYQQAVDLWEKDRVEQIIKQDQALAATEQIKILVAGHCYNLYDEYIGVPVLKGIRRLDAFAVCADKIDHGQAQQDSLKICERVPWMMSRELLGAVEKYHDKVDGIILLTAFPCGPDSMINEMIIRRIKDRPILNLLLDSQDASAGVETRLESFIDIIRFRKAADKNG